MRNAPPVIVPVGRFVWGHAFTATLAGVVILATVWVWLTSQASWLQGRWWALLLVLAAAGAWRWAPHEVLPVGTLSWDGESWHYQPQKMMGRDAMVAVVVRVLWDAGSAMLVAVSTQSGEDAGQGGHWRGQRFAWLQAAHMPGQWHAWRCAVYANDIL